MGRKSLDLPALSTFLYFFKASWAEETTAGLSCFPTLHGGVTLKGPPHLTMTCCPMSRAAVTFSDPRIVFLLLLTMLAAEV